MSAFIQRELGCSLSENSTVTPKRKNTFLPLLTVLFLVSYGIMTMLVVEQGNTIQSQRLLIKQLFNDSVQLSALKGKAAQKRHTHPAPPKSFARRQPPQASPRQRQPRVDAPQAPADLQRSAVSL